MTTTAVSVEKLHEVVPFRALSERAQRAVLSAGKITSHEPGCAVVTEGKEPFGFHLILEGTAVVEMAGKEQRRLALVTTSASCH